VRGGERSTAKNRPSLFHALAEVREVPIRTIMTCQFLENLDIFLEKSRTVSDDVEYQVGPTGKNIGFLHQKLVVVPAQRLLGRYNY
jgi:hypothetical protein